MYGHVALQEGLLYHFSRVDHRHNYSMWWYYIYLARSNAAVCVASTASTVASLSIIGKLLVLPQLVLLVYSSLGIAPHNLPLALFTQTYLFVIHNKVITAQYFTWYLCLLPICSDSLFQSNMNRVKTALLLLILSIVLWLASAYCLEMQGMNVHSLVWFMSIVHFMANINMLRSLLASTTGGGIDNNNENDKTTMKKGSKVD